MSPAAPAAAAGTDQAPPAPEQLIELALRAIDLAHSQPQAAREAALAVLRAAKGPESVGARAIAERALGQIAHLFEDLGSAREHLTRSIRYARRAGDRHGEAEARLSRAFSFAQEGRLTAAFGELDRAEAGMIGSDRDLGRVHNQRALIWWVKGGYAQAVPHFERAVEHITRAGNDHDLVRVLVNRGVLHGQLGAYAAAERDLTRSEELAVRLDLPMAAAVARQDLGWVAAQRGDVPVALARYDQAERDYEPHGAELGTLLLDRCAVLIGARLLAEAIQTAERALRSFTESGVATSIPEAQLALAEALLLSERPQDALAQASAALAEFQHQHRKEWAALARYAVLRARLLDESFDPAQARRGALRVAAALEAGGLTEAALDVRIVAARLGLACGQVAAAKRELARASSARNRGTVERRTRAWQAEALLRLTSGERSRARSALRAGLRILEEHRAMLGATDLRAAASAHRVDLARLGFEMAIADARPDEALRWVEHSRAGLARLRAVRPPGDEPLAQALTQLRATLHEIEEATRSGDRIAGLRARQTRLEREIRDHCRTLPAAALSLPAPPPPLSVLARRLGDRALVEYVRHDGDLYVLLFRGGQVRVRNLGPTGVIEDAIRVLVLLLERAARDLGPAGRRRETVERLISQAAIVDDAILAPLAADLAGAALVIAPTASIRSVPWFALPSVAGRPASVVPSATVWFEAAGPGGRTRDDVVLAAGPDLPGAEHEVAVLAGQYPRSTALSGAAATVAATLRALDGAQLAHIAAHGTFRADSPLFSALRLADGPLTVYDLEGITAAPHTVVLAACDSARHTSQPGDDLLGLASAFLSLGTRTLIAPLVSLPDDEAGSLMIDLHARLRTGSGPAAALAAAQQAAADSGAGPAYAAAAGLICFGAG